VCREVIAGRSTTDIAGRLFVAATTVQDHLEIGVQQGGRTKPR
jgi:ATP/maltotriose-dependent transcriptional regulator MalT